MLSGGGGAAGGSRFRPFFSDKNGKARLVGGEYDNKASFIERTTAADVFDVDPAGTVNATEPTPLLDTPELRLVAAVIEDAARLLAIPTVRANDHLKRQAQLGEGHRRVDAGLQLRRVLRVAAARRGLDARAAPEARDARQGNRPQAPRRHPKADTGQDRGMIAQQRKRGRLC